VSGELSQHLHIDLFTIHFNIILQPTPRSFKCKPSSIIGVRPQYPRSLFKDRSRLLSLCGLYLFSKFWVPVSLNSVKRLNPYIFTYISKFPMYGLFLLLYYVFISFVVIRVHFSARLIDHISAAVILVLSFVFIIQFSLPRKSVAKARIIINL
jgi:hypothetical protein